MLLPRDKKPREPDPQPVLRKDIILKCVTVDDLKEALLSEDNPKSKPTMEYTFHDGSILSIPLDKGLYWVFYKDMNGKYMDDSYWASDDAVGRGKVVVWKEFAEHMNLEPEVWYVNRDKGMERLR